MSDDLFDISLDNAIYRMLSMMPVSSTPSRPRGYPMGVTSHNSGIQVYAYQHRSVGTQRKVILANLSRDQIDLGGRMAAAARKANDQGVDMMKAAAQQARDEWENADANR